MDKAKDLVLDKKRGSGAGKKAANKKKIKKKDEKPRAGEMGEAVTSSPSSAQQQLMQVRRAMCRGLSRVCSIEHHCRLKGCWNNPSPTLLIRPSLVVVSFGFSDCTDRCSQACLRWACRWGGRVSESPVPNTHHGGAAMNTDSAPLRMCSSLRCSTTTSSRTPSRTWRQRRSSSQLLNVSGSARRSSTAHAERCLASLRLRSRRGSRRRLSWLSSERSLRLRSPTVWQLRSSRRNASALDQACAHNSTSLPIHSSHRSQFVRWQNQRRHAGDNCAHPPSRQWRRRERCWLRAMPGVS